MKFFFLFLTLNYYILFAQSLELLYEEREPYIKTENSGISGIIATPLINAINKTDIKINLVKKPSKRHLFEIKSNKRPICAIGWFKNKKRKSFAKFSKSLYQDKAMGILVRKDNTSISKIKDINTLLKNKSLKLLAKSSYSYGSYIDNKLLEYKVKRKDVSSDNKTMIKLIKKKRADYMFLSHEEALFLLDDKSEVVFFSLKGIPKGNKRYLICSKKTNDNTLTLINKHLE